MTARTDHTPLVFPFDHHHDAPPCSLRHQLGGKGANLAEMTTVLGLGVPPGFTITTDACRAFLSDGWPAHLDRQIDRAVEELEASTGRRLGDPVDPLLVSVRSGASDSMPGMLDTVLNVGLNEQVRRALAASSGREDFAWDCYRRFLLMYGRVVLQRGDQLADRDGANSREVCRSLLAHDAPAFPDDPREQLAAAIRAVFASWNAPRADAYRQHAGLDGDGGTAVNVQAMVFGNRDERSGSGVAFTRDLSTGERTPRGEFLWQAQGEDVVAGTHVTLDLGALAGRLPDVHQQLLATFDHLERHFADVCEVEFTVESSRLMDPPGTSRPAVRVGRLPTCGEARNTARMVDHPRRRSDSDNPRRSGPGPTAHVRERFPPPRLRRGCLPRRGRRARGSSARTGRWSSPRWVSR